MSQENCTLTTEDFIVLETMLDRVFDGEASHVEILKRKIGSAKMVFSEDVAEDVATLNSRVTFSIDGHASDTLMISQDDISSTDVCRPVTALLGLALVGLTEGEEFVFTNIDGTTQRIMLQKVHYQPEGARRETKTMKMAPDATHKTPALRVIRGGLCDQTRRRPINSDGFDDPGPSAA